MKYDIGEATALTKSNLEKGQKSSNFYSLKA